MEMNSFNKTRRSYKIFVIFHNTIDLSYFDPSVLDNIVFVNVNPSNPNRYSNIHLINLYELPGFIPLGKWYTESEVIYNVYRNKELTEGLDYLGFIHYDIDFTPVNEAFIQDIMGKYAVVNFQPNSFQNDFDQHILMDPDQPDVQTGTGINCYVPIFEDFNKFYGTNYNLKDYFSKNINLCSCFLIKMDLFREMMEFASKIIESRKLDAFDTPRKYRIQGGFMERYFGVWSMLKIDGVKDLRLRHDFVQTHIQMPFFRRIKSRLAAFLRK